MNNALIFISFSIFTSLVSFLLNKQKTILGFKKGWKMFRNIFIPFLNILILVSLILFIIPPQMIESYLGAFSSLKIPMLGIEIGYLGLKFTLVRTLVALPLFIAVGYFMEWYLRDKKFKINDVK